MDVDFCNTRQQMTRRQILWLVNSGTGTNLKVAGGTGPKQKWGHRSGAKKGDVFGRARPLLGSKSTISRFGERFRDGQYSFGQFLVCCSPTHGAPPCPAICQSGGGACHCAPWSRSHALLVHADTNPVSPSAESVSGISPSCESVFPISNFSATDRASAIRHTNTPIFS